MKFLISGYGAKSSDVANFLHENSLKNVEFIISKGTSDVAMNLSQVKVFCFPSSHEESLGLTALEALHMGCYVLSAPQGSLEEILIENVNGQFVDFEDFPLLVRLIKNNKSRKATEINKSCALYVDSEVNRILSNWLVLRASDVSSGPL